MNAKDENLYYIYLDHTADLQAGDRGQPEW